MKREFWTKKVARIVADIEAGKTPSPVRELYVFGSYAHGAPECRDLDLVVVHDPPAAKLVEELTRKAKASPRNMVERYGAWTFRFDAMMSRVIRRPGEEIDLLIGPDLDNALSAKQIKKEDLCLVWSSVDRDWEGKLSAKVRAHLRGKIWYLCYHENGGRRRPRAGADRHVVKQLAAQINAQLEVGAPAALSFQATSIPELRDRWLQHHEQVFRSSVQTIHRYRTASDHLLRFLEQRPVKQASQFHSSHAEEFVRYLRTIRVFPNGRANTRKAGALRQKVELCPESDTYAVAALHVEWDATAATP